MHHSALIALLPSLLLLAPCLPAEETIKPAEEQVVLTVQIKSAKPIAFTAEALGKLERATLKSDDEDQTKQQTYEGVALASILHAAGVTWGTKCSLWLDCYVIVEAADDYRVVFSIPEIDPGLAHQAVLLADRCDGKPLSKSSGPYELVEADAKQRGRWVKQVTTIRVCMAAE